MHGQDRIEAVSHCSKCLLLSLSVATETEQKQKEEQEQKLNRKSYIPVAVNIYFCSCFTCIIFCCNRNQINRKKPTVITSYGRTLNEVESRNRSLRNVLIYILDPVLSLSTWLAVCVQGDHAGLGSGFG